MEQSAEGEVQSEIEETVGEEVIEENGTDYEAGDPESFLDEVITEGLEGEEEAEEIFEVSESFIIGLSLIANGDGDEGSVRKELQDLMTEHGLGPLMGEIVEGEDEELDSLLDELESNGEL